MTFELIQYNITYLKHKWSLISLNGAHYVQLWEQVEILDLYISSLNLFRNVSKL